MWQNWKADWRVDFQGHIVFDKSKYPKDESSFIRRINASVLRKISSRGNPARGIWVGLGMMGLIGWSVAIPTLLGIALGMWIDKHHHGQISWTLTLLLIGLIIGCLNAWRWIAAHNDEKQDIREDKNG